MVGEQLFKQEMYIGGRAFNPILRKHCMKHLALCTQQDPEIVLAVVCDKITPLVSVESGAIVEHKLNITKLRTILERLKSMNALV